MLQFSSFNITYLNIICTNLIIPNLSLADIAEQKYKEPFNPKKN